MGGTLFASGSYGPALAKFTKSLRYLNVHPVLPDTHDSKAKPEFAREYTQLKAALYLNSALCALKMAEAAAGDAKKEGAQGEAKAHARQAEDSASSAISVVESYHVPGSATSSKDDADLAKAYYRRALARSRLNDFEGAGSDLTDAARLQPNDAGIKREKVKLEEAKKAQKERQRRQYAKMFG